MADIFVPKIPKEFYCESCTYRCSNKKDYNKHLATRKHQNASKGLTNADEKIPKNPDFTCDCGNTYKHRQSLYKHQKYCLMNEENEEQMNYSVNNIYKDTIIAVPIEKYFQKLIFSFFFIINYLF